MASSKKKPSAKRTVRYAAKAQSAAKKTSSAPTSHQASWIGNDAASWQKGAQDWAKQSAKFYQLPFSQEEMGAATQQAAQNVKSATESMVKASTDMMQQMFSQSQKSGAVQGLDPRAWMEQMQRQFAGFDASGAQQRLSNFVHESSEQMAKASQSSTRAAAEGVELTREGLEALSDVCSIIVNVSKEMMAESIAFMNKQFAQNVELSKQALTCRTLNDMFDLTTRITKANLDAFFSQGVKISEVLFQCANDISEPLNEHMSDASQRLTRAVSA